MSQPQIQQIHLDFLKTYATFIVNYDRVSPICHYNPGIAVALNCGVDTPERYKGTKVVSVEPLSANAGGMSK
jgi:hypothetical protein